MNARIYDINHFDFVDYHLWSQKRLAALEKTIEKLETRAKKYEPDSGI
jgi:hypothetical protein